jgi:hypothetical protein
MDYESVITPGVRCSNCLNVKGGIGPPIIFFCELYDWYNNNDQAEHCINYLPKSKANKDTDEVNHE